MRLLQFVRVYQCGAKLQELRVVCNVLHYVWET